MLCALKKQNHNILKTGSSEDIQPEIFFPLQTPYFQQ